MKRTCRGINFKGGGTKMHENKVRSGNNLAWSSMRTYCNSII